MAKMTKTQISGNFLRYLAKFRKILRYLGNFGIFTEKIYRFLAVFQSFLAGFLTEYSVLDTLRPCCFERCFISMAILLVQTISDILFGSSW